MELLAARVARLLRRLARRHGRLRFDLAGLAGEGPRASPPAAPPEGQEGSQPQMVLPDAEVRRLERENILAALRQSGGRIRGPGGAAELAD